MSRQIFRKTVAKSFAPTRVLLWCLVMLGHLLLFFFLSRASGWSNTKISSSSMVLVKIQPLPLSDLVANRPPKKRFSNHAEKETALKLSAPAVSASRSAKPAQAEGSRNYEPIPVEEGNKTALRSESLNSTASGKDLTNLGSISSRYKLQLPKSDVEENLTPAQQAAQDVRSNSAKLTRSEKFSVAMGTLDCVFQTRLSDGKVVREPGKWIIVTARSNVTKLALATSRYCVRLHQAEDENGNDLTAISAGIKGKL
jgi:hypothetical protein